MTRKVTLLLLLLLVLTGGQGWAQQCAEEPVQVARLSPAMMGSVPSAAAGESEEAGTLFTCTWSDPTTILNTAAGTIHVWTSETSDHLSVDTTGKGWNGEANSLKYTHTDTQADYLVATITSAGSLALRFNLYITALGVGSGSCLLIANFRNTDWGENDAILQLCDDGGQIEIRGYCTDADGGSATIATSDIHLSLNTAYQVEMLLIETTPTNTGFQIRAYNANGSSQVGSTIVGDGVKNTQTRHVNSFWLGLIAAVNTTTNTYYMDSVRVEAQGTFIGPRTY